MKKVILILAIGLLLGGCASETERRPVTEYESDGKAQGHKYFAYSLPIKWIMTYGTNAPYDTYKESAARAASAISQEEANRLALEACHDSSEGSCIIFMEGSNATPEFERLIKKAEVAEKKAELVEQKKISDKKQVKIDSMINKTKNTCKELGFAEGTEKFADCSLKLYSQEVELAADKRQTVVMQPQSSGSNSITIYDPVRDSNALIRQGQRMLSGACTLGINC